MGTGKEGTWDWGLVSYNKIEMNNEDIGKYIDRIPDEVTEGVIKQNLTDAKSPKTL